MEDTLRDYRTVSEKWCESVLILVLMEDTLRAKKEKKQPKLKSLNPCSNGRYSQSCHSLLFLHLFHVLILVLMEDTLRVAK